MKKYSVVLMTILLLIVSSCEDVEVYYPIPLHSELEINITVIGGEYDLTIPLDANEFAGNIEEELQAAGLSLEDVEKIVLEGAAYIVVETNNSEAVVNDSLNIRYGGPDFVNMMYLNHLHLGQSLNIPRLDVLAPEGVDLLNSLFADIKNKQSLSTVYFQSKGTMVEGDPPAVFRVLIDLTITAVVKNTQTIFDPLS